MLKAVTCIGNGRGFRRDGVFFPAGYWTLMDAEALTEGQVTERHLRIVDATGPDDPALAPMPVIVPGQESAHPGTPVQALAAEAERLRGENAELAAQLKSARAEIKALKSGGVLSKAAAKEREKGASAPGSKAAAGAEPDSKAASGPGATSEATETGTEPASQGTAAESAGAGSGLMADANDPGA